MNLYLEEALSIKSMVEKNKKFLDNEFIYSLTFLDEEGMEISQSCDSRLLVRLNSFQISLNGGEKYYKCFNINYLANDNLQEKPIIDENRNWHEIEKLMRKNRLSLKK